MFKVKRIEGLDQECVLVRGIVLNNVLGASESTILYIQPCASVQGRVNCELRFGMLGTGVSERFFNFQLLSKILEAYSNRFAENRASDTLGVARIQWRGKKILIFSNGRIVIREALSEDDAHSTVDFLSKLLAPSISCAYCGQPLEDCIVGLCGRCTKHPISKVKFSKRVLWKQACSRFDKAANDVSRLKTTVLEAFLGKSMVTGSMDLVKTQVADNLRLALDLLVSSTDREELIAGLVLFKANSILELCVEILVRMCEKFSLSELGKVFIGMLFGLLDYFLVWARNLYASLMERTIKTLTLAEKVYVSQLLSRIEKNPELNLMASEILGNRGLDFLKKLVRIV